VDTAIGGVTRFVLRLVGRFLPANLRRARVTAAHHLGGLLSRDTARADIAPHDAAAAKIVSWRSGFAERRFQELDAQPQARPLTELQSGYVKATRALREAGLPSGHP
jgi:hypothetical protein